MEGHRMSNLKRWLVVVVFAAAFAWVESAAVTYLRIHVGRIDPYQTNPLPLANDLGRIELVREVATLIMIVSIGYLAGRNRHTRTAYAALTFGVWDIFYYLFLWITVGWPHTLIDWDVLFLLPLPWWGPVIAPLAIAAIIVLASTLVALFDNPEGEVWPTRKAWSLCLPGVVLALIVFMQDALRALPHGERAIRDALPTSFAWPFFGLALLLMSAPIVDLLMQIRSIRSSSRREARARIKSGAEG
jgi:hypothetical protein